MHNLELNRNAFEYTQTVLPKFLNICDPIFNYIDNVSYCIIFKNKYYFKICNNVPWTEYYLKSTYGDKRENFDIAIPTNIKNGEYYHAIWPNYSIHWPTLNHDDELEASQRFNMYNGFSMLIKNHDYIEAFWFTYSNPSNKDFISSFYLKNIVKLKEFCTYFRQAFSQEINNLNYQNFAKYELGIKIYHYDDKHKMLDIDKFLSLTDTRKYPIINNNSEIFLSNREYQCLNYMTHGKTAKEIAMTLELSSRSIELYIKNIKNKLKVNNKFEAVKLFKQNIQDWL